MSESDSDLEFESADEETEQDSSEKCAVVEETEQYSSEKCTVVEKTEQNSKEKHALVKETEPDSVEKCAEKTENSSSEINETLPNLHIEENKSIVRNTLSEVPNTLKKESQTEEIPPKEDVSSKNIQVINTNSTISETSRVPLRLEKKLHKKNTLKNDTIVDDIAAANTPNVSSSTENAAKPAESSWGFGGWGSSLLTSAVSTFTSQVSQGIGTVLETVESSLGAMPPEELAKKFPPADNPDSGEVKCDKTAVEDSDKEYKSSLLSDVSSWTKVLENTGSKVLMGSLDTLELIGKKTMDILTEGDPGLRKKRAVLSEHLTLSQILREAKEQDANQTCESEDGESISIPNYSQLLDDYQGLAHLEALEMLSRQSEAQVKRALISSPSNSEIRRSLDEIKDICTNIPSLEDSSDCEKFEDFETLLRQHIFQINLPFNIDNVIKTQKKISASSHFDKETLIIKKPEEVYQKAVSNLAEFTACCMEAFHKLAELILVQTTPVPDFELHATHLTGITTVMCIEVNNLATKYQHCLESVFEDSKETNVTLIVTNLYVEAENSNRYIQDAFQLLIPILQGRLLESLK